MGRNAKPKTWAIIERVILVGLFVSLGYFYAIQTPFLLIRAGTKFPTIDHLLPAEGKKVVSRAYAAGEASRLDEFSWNIPNVPAPFVGSVPEPGQHYNAFINSYFFRNETEPSLPKPANRVRVFLTGGSVAFGCGAPSQNTTIGAYLQTLLNNGEISNDKRQFEVFTVANPAWSTTHERIMIENRLVEMEPDLVISYSGLNDIHWAQSGENIMWFRAPYEKLFFRILQLVFAHNRTTPLPDVAEPTPFLVDPALITSRLGRNVRLAATALRWANAKYIFVLQPSWMTYKFRNQDNGGEFFHGHLDYIVKSYDSLAAELANIKDENFIFFDFREIFDGVLPDNRIFIDAYHTADKGNLIAAKALFDKIKTIPFADH